MEFLKTLLKTLFWPDFERDHRINLFIIFPKIKAFFYNRRNFAYIRTFGDIVFLTLIIMGLFGPQDPKANIMLFLAWGVWWSSVVLSWFFLGRMWCAFCPFPGLARLFQNLKMSLFKYPSSFLKDYGIHLATTLFFIIIWLETTTELVHSPRYTAIFLISIWALAGILGMIYREYAWCRYLCPLGRITGVAATMSLIEFRADYTLCRRCNGAPCKRGTDQIKPCPVYLGAVAVQNNLNCFICGHCLILCPHDSPTIYIRHPLKEIILNKGKGITCSYIIPFLIGSQLARFLFETPFFHVWRSSIGFSSEVLFTILFFWFSISIIVLSKLSGSYFKYFEDPILGRFNLAIAILIPLAFTGELIYRSTYLLKGIGEFLPTLGRQFDLSYLLNLHFEIPKRFIELWNVSLLFLAFSGSIYLLCYFYFKDFQREIPLKRYVPFLILVFILYLAYFALILTSI
ncbi:MAG: hypothetical protein N2327_01545 [Caldimicrobium sp.]|nr:hypothetical protein [Caldimicrobium sp.]MCX7873102.1 hypothetical protein [Caldimicrobium sp.]MDW8094527.1 hypothetical protein [Caldimicrobium sp.]